MIRLLHHHLRRGGVTRVLLTTASILRDAGEEVEIVCGEAPVDPVPEGVGFRLVPGMGYENPETPTDPTELANRLRALHREGDLWHVHNHSLGKNPGVTQAVLLLAEAGIPLVLQPHDFAEDGRPVNLSRLTRTLPHAASRLYPVAPHIQYAVLQDRDRQVLLGAGVPAETVRVLPNPITLDAGAPPPDPASTRLLYLTRAIRRKNIGEFLYWARLLGDRFEFATSLIPQNPVEKKGFDAWTAFAAAQGIPVAWGVGMADTPFEEVVGSAAACITTSVGEGFGMSFLEPYVLGRPVAGRNLPEITRGFQADGVGLDHLYDHLPVEADRLDAGFWGRALEAVCIWRRAMGFVGDLQLQTLQEAWVDAGRIDFGRLDETAQRQVISSLTPGSGSVEDLLPASGGEVEANAGRIREAYSGPATLERLRDLYAAVESPAPVVYADAKRVREAFADLNTLSLLRL